jgi:uncharacterized membrane protein
MNDNRRDRFNKTPGSRRNPEGLPSPETLEAYDTVLKGSAQLIIDMFSREQVHRHAWENRALRVYQISTLLGQVLGFLIAISIFISAGVIGMYGNASIAAFIWVFGMAIVTIAAIVWWYAKSMGSRPLFARPAMRTSFRPDKGPQAHGQQQ